MKLTRIIILMTALLLSCLITGCGGGGGGVSIDTTLPVIANPVITPPDIIFPGGIATFSVTATDNTAIASVSLSITNSLTGAVVTRPLTNTTGNTYEVSGVNVIYSGVIPHAQTYTFSVTATDTAGNIRTQAAGQIILQPDLPPPAP